MLRMNVYIHQGLKVIYINHLTTKRHWSEVQIFLLGRKTLRLSKCQLMLLAKWLTR